MDADSVEVSESYHCRLWQLALTRSEVIEPATASSRPTLQPIIHATGTLIVPSDHDLVVMSPDGWYLGHDASEFASEAAAVAFAKLYLPAIGVKRLDLMFRPYDYSIIEIDELIIASGVRVEALKSYFTRLLESFEDNTLPDSYGRWCHTLSLIYEDESDNYERNENGEYSDYVVSPTVLLINVQGCALTFVDAMHQNGKLVSTVKRDASKKPTPSGEALASMVMEAVKGLSVDVVIYDEGLH
jgi:hypothetical protein